MASSHLNWMIIRDNNAFLLKQKNIRKPFSKESNNLTNVSSYRFSGLVHNKTIGIVPADKKGFTLVYKKARKANHPSKSVAKVTFKSGPRAALKSLKNTIRKNHYRRDLGQAALRRASAVLRSQREIKTKKAKPAATKAKAE